MVHYLLAGATWGCERPKDTPFPCTGAGAGELPVRVAVNTGRLPLTPEKRVGYRVER